MTNSPGAYTAASVPSITERTEKILARIKGVEMRLTGTFADLAQPKLREYAS